MRAVVISSHDGPDAVRVDDVDVPGGAEHGLVEIDVRASGVSFPELLQTRGLYQDSPPLPFVPGVEAAGTVRSAPADSGLAPGTPVIAVTGHGGLGQIALAPAAYVFPLPDGLDYAQGAAIPLNFFTAYFAVSLRARMKAGERVLVHGAAGGLGTALCSAAISALPADGQWRDAVMAVEPEGIDIVLDPVGGPRAVDSLRVLRPLGRYVVLGFTAGTITELKVNRLLLRNLDVVGAGWGAYVLQDPAVFREIARGALRLIEDGSCVPVVGHRFPLEDAPAAFAVLEERRARGKVVVEMP
ncbi:MAG: NADPH:quinone oxidoreductase family protein [bacterium]